MSNQSLGAYGEYLAGKHLESLGYRILEKNFKNKLGEIDLIAKDGKTICFVEVKTRKSIAQGRPFEAVHALKIRKLTQMAHSYLKYKFRTVDVPARFDVVSILENNTGKPEIQHLKNAFDAVY